MTKKPVEIDVATLWITKYVVADGIVQATKFGDRATLSQDGKRLYVHERVYGLPTAFKRGEWFASYADAIADGIVKLRRARNTADRTSAALQRKIDALCVERSAALVR